jgi:hypothetical protein
VSELFRVADEQRAAILARERAVSAELVRIYAQTYLRIRTQVDVLQAQITTAREAGETVGTGWLYQRERLQTIRLQVERELLTFADTAETLITSEQRAQIIIAREHIGAQIVAGAPSPGPGVSLSFARLPTGPVQELVGVLANGSPLRALLNELGPDGAKVVADGLLQGVALGKGTGAIARDIRAGLGGNLARAQTIARNEVLRSYRESARQTAIANQDVLKNWVWRAAHSTRTCLSCIALDGSVHPISERMSDHVKGRCTPIYQSRFVATSQPETGAEWFARQSDEVQAQMLGPSKFLAFKDQALTLDDLVGTKQSRVWGRSHHEQSLSAAIGEKRAREYIIAASTARSAS